MILGIVGSEAAKFTELGEARALDFIKGLVSDPSVTGVASGHCHLGGIDIWAEVAANAYKKELFIYPPTTMSCDTDYKPRNIQIANKSDKVWCISVDELPPNYRGMTFKSCYHCERNAVIPYPQHIKSGGCWTMHYAIKHGKQGSLFVVQNF